MRTHNEHLGLRWEERARFAHRELRSRPLMTLLSIMAVSVAVVYLLGLGYYGLSLYRYQSEVLDETAMTRIVVMTTNATDENQRFTQERLEELQKLPGVVIAFPKVEIGAKVYHRAGSKMDTTLEGTVPNDPAMAQGRLAWGRSVEKADAREIILPKKLFEKMGGSLTTFGPQPAELFVDVNRTTNGTQEKHTIRAQVVGLLATSTEEKVYVPLSLAKHVDQWCSHKLKSMPGPNGKIDLPGLQADAILAYGPRHQQHRLKEEARRYGFSFQELNNLNSLSHDSRTLWATIQAKNGSLKAKELLAKLPSDLDWKAYSSRVTKARVGDSSFSLVSLPPGDPRWKLLGAQPVPKLGQVYGLQQSGRILRLKSGEALAILDELDLFPVQGDFLCTSETQQWLTFDEKEDPISTERLLVYTDDRALAEWVEEKDPKSKIAASEPLTWAMLGLIDKDSRKRDEQIRLFHRRYPSMKIRPTYVGGIRCRGRAEPIQVRSIPDEIFELFTGRRREKDWGSRPRIPCLCVGPDNRPWLRSGVNVDNCYLTTVAFLHGNKQELWIADRDREHLRYKPLRDGVVIWSEWHRMMDLKKLERSREINWKLITQNKPTFSLVTSLKAAQLEDRKSSRNSRLRIHRLRAIDALVRLNGIQRSYLCATSVDNEFQTSPRRAWIDLSGKEFADLKLSVDGSASFALTGRKPDKPLPAGVILVDPSTFRRAAFERAEHRGLLSSTGEQQITIQVSPLRYARFVKAALAQDLKVIPHQRVEQEPLVQYVVRPRLMAKKKGQDLLTALKWLQPAITAALPRLHTDGKVDSFILEVHATEPNDPLRYSAGISYGRWISDDSREHEIVLPLKVAKSLSSNSPERLVGREVDIQFFPDRGVSANKQGLRLPFRVVGISEAKIGWSSVQLVQSLQLWKQNDLIYNAADRSFRSPNSVYKRRGHVRCNLDMAEVSSVGPMVKWLEQKGWRTEHHLAEQEGLRQLGRVLVVLVMLFVVGFATCAAITVFANNAMKIARKTYEIGLLRAHGLSSWQIVSIYCLQSLMVGLAAFILGTLLVVATEPLLSSIIRSTFQLPPTALAERLFSLSNWPLYAIALGLALGASALGALIPAFRVCRLSPVEAMEQQD